MLRLLSRVDYFLLIPALLLTLLGSVILSSISPTSYPEHFIYLVLAFSLFFFFANIDADLLRRLGWPFYFFSLVILVLTLVIGTTSRGATRWISIGGVSLQTSEVVKPLLAIFCGTFLSARTGALKYFQLGALIVIPAMLVFVQPDLGSAIVVGCGFVGAALLAGIPVKIVLTAIILLLASLPIAMNFLHPYQKDRITAFLNPASDPLGIGYNSIQAMIAIGSGGFFGRGLGQGTQSQLAFLPESHTDFIFSALSEELGFLGSMLVVLAFVVIFLRLGTLAFKTESIFAEGVLGAIFFTIFIQATVNIGMNLGVLPITGIPLPFVSAGGSSLLAMSALLGIASSVSNSLKDDRGSGIL